MSMRQVGISRPVAITMALTPMRNGQKLSGSMTEPMIGPTAQPAMLHGAVETHPAATHPVLDDLIDPCVAGGEQQRVSDPE